MWIFYNVKIFHNVVCWGGENTEVKQRLEERLIYTPLPVQTCACVCEDQEEKKSKSRLSVLSRNDREGSFTDLFYS